MNSGGFFSERSESSALKARIVAKYLPAWANVVARRAGSYIVYFDPFCGPGVYEDGEMGTPLLVLDAVAESPVLCQKLITVFGDSDEDHCSRLKSRIATLKAAGRLGRYPTVFHQEVNEGLAMHLSEQQLSPTLTFLDPCGYKGISLSLINSVLKDRYCDCLFFFNYDGVNRGLSVPGVADHINALFGPERADGIRAAVRGLTPDDRERLVMRELDAALRDGHANYVRWFRFIRNGARRTSHYLVFVSKSFRGYDIMKQIMASEGKRSPEGVPLYEFDPQEPEYIQTGLFDGSQLDSLREDLTRRFSGQKLALSDLHEQHSANTDYLLDNYREVLRSLEDAGSITCDPVAEKRPRRSGVRTMAPHTVIAFNE